MKNRYDLIIVGGGPAGLAAGIQAKKAGVENLIILERDHELGGILNQCIHNGFGLHTFKEELTGPEYADRFIQQAAELNIEYKLHTMVCDISHDKVVTVMNREEGMVMYQAKAVVLAMGCRERPRGALNIPGYRPAGIYSAGTAQRLVNIEGFMPDWIGEFYAYYQWYYNLPSSEVIKKVPLDFLMKAYYGLHDLELELAVKKVGEEQ